ncbi:PLC-like phosphodiesterase [Polychaeton citri CBS 116435]|uniref:Phosphoinositide phospholipase C n=1 Tax=Polychaeton citri CBS 116435 TaxID=1314669 RepID=A0A9P4QJ13_9PEZI|nr:PLC-like phosphodiesterase [Polychaeton citri CBS 116435]
MFPSPAIIPKAARSERTSSERSPSPSRIPSGALADLGKSPGIMRRLSQNASNKMLRRRRSTTAAAANRIRDQSAGPVLVRARSGSVTSDAHDVSDLDLDSQTDEVQEDSQYTELRDFNALGINMTKTNNPPGGLDSAMVPAISAILEQGTNVIKVTKKKRKDIRIFLDPNSARVCWHPSNPNKSFFIDDVREIRMGADSRNARDDVEIPDAMEDRWITIVFDALQRTQGRTIKTMHLLTMDRFIAELWGKALGHVARERIEIMNALAANVEKSERSMILAWDKAMARKTPTAPKTFTLDDAKWLCRNLEINCSENTVKTHFKRSDSGNAGSLTWDGYQHFVNSFKQRKDISHLFRNVSMGTDIDMPKTGFFNFLKNDQAVNVDRDLAHWETVFYRFSKPNTTPRLPDAEPVLGQRTMNLQGFQNFLTSSYNAPLKSSKGEVSLDRPLNEYFISSSHNTYLLGYQVRGVSSVHGYITALVKGCRCVEVDCWDGENGRPMVTHGRTMTTKVSFEDCISVISKYAFHTSPYPLIISLEVHCSPDQQQTMVDLMRKYFDGMMITEPIMTNSISLPSPEELRHKILIKVKASFDVEHAALGLDNSSQRHRARSIGAAITPSSFSRTNSIEKDSVTSSVTSTPLVASPPANSSPMERYTAFSTPNGSTTSGPSMAPSSSTSDSDNAPLSAETKRSKTSKIIPSLGKLGVYTQGIKYSDFNSTEAKTYNHIYSFAESTFDKLCTKNTDTKSLLEKHNMRYLMRVYPAQRRIDSSNFNPLQSWRRGVQMAALNWQTHDVHMQVNEAMFAAGSDRLGYVLKPEELRHAKHLPIADTLAEAPERKERRSKKIVKFAVDIISAQRLPRPRNSNTDGSMNPYIEFEMYSAEDKARGIARGEGGTDASARDGSSGIGSPLRKRTRVVEGNGFDPVWNQTISMEVETKYPTLIFVRWTVWNSPTGNSTSHNTLLATFTAKLSSLQQGYRHLPLFNPNGEQYRDAKLFVRIKKQAPSPLQVDQYAYGMYDPAAASPRVEAISRPDRTWPRRIFSRNPSERRKKDHQQGLPASTGEHNGNALTLSRTSSTDRESVRS